MIRNPQKAHPCVEKTSYDVQIVKSGPWVQSVHVIKRLKKTKNKPLQWQTGYLPRSQTPLDQNQILHKGSLRGEGRKKGCSSKYQVPP